MYTLNLVYLYLYYLEAFSFVFETIKSAQLAHLVITSYKRGILVITDSAAQGTDGNDERFLKT
jgi:hypothetical protein